MHGRALLTSAIFTPPLHLGTTLKALWILALPHFPVHLEALHLSRYIAGQENLDRVWCRCSLNHTLRHIGLLNKIPTPDTLQVPTYWTAFPQHASLVQIPSLIPRVFMLHGLLRLRRHVVCLLLSPFLSRGKKHPLLCLPSAPFVCYCIWSLPNLSLFPPGFESVTAMAMR